VHGRRLSSHCVLLYMYKIHLTRTNIRELLRVKNGVTEMCVCVDDQA